MVLDKFCNGSISDTAEKRVETGVLILDQKIYVFLCRLTYVSALDVGGLSVLAFSS